MWRSVLSLVAQLSAAMAVTACQAKPEDNWPAAAQITAEAPPSPPAAPTRSGTPESRVPVLLPGDPALRAASRVVWAGSAYTALIAHGGVSIQVAGTPAAGAAGPLLVQRTEYGLDAGFGRGGGAYNITLICNVPTDARCADEAYIRKLARSLTAP